MFFNPVKIVLRFFREIGPEIVDFGPLPGPTRPRGGLGKAPAGAPLDLHRFFARLMNYKAIPGGFLNAFVTVFEFWCHLRSHFV